MASVDYRPVNLQVKSYSKGPLHRIFSAPLSTVVGLVLITIVAFLNAADLSVDKDKVGLDVQVMVKLAGIGLAAVYGGVGVLTDRRVRDLAQSFPVFWVVIIIAMYFVSAPFSMDPKVSLASTLSMVAVLLMTLRAWAGIVQCSLVAGVLRMAGGWCSKGAAA